MQETPYLLSPFVQANYLGFDLLELFNAHYYDNHISAKYPLTVV